MRSETIDSVTMSSIDDPFLEKGRKSKRRKPGTSSLLEELRFAKYLSKPETNEEYQERMDLVLGHSSHFPSKLRHAIDAARRASDGSKNPPRRFFNLVHQSVVSFCFGWPIPDEFGDGAFDEEHPTAWHGLDSNIDTEDEIELALRLFPKAFSIRKIFRSGRRTIGRYDPIRFLASSEKAVFFMPLMLDLATEFNELQGVNFVALFCTLLNNTLTIIRFKENPSKELDEISLAVLVRLKEKGYVTATDQILNFVLTNFVAETIRSSRDIGFIERRIRLLIEWKPTLIKYGYYSIYLVGVFGKFDPQRLRGSKLDVRFYEFALELATLHYPQELLGFGFHHLNFESTCDTFGNKEVKRSMKNKIAGAIAQSDNNENNETLMEFILQAATDREISLDGVYTLVRFDPTVVMNSIK